MTTLTTTPPPVREATRDDVDSAIARAREAQPRWAATPGPERRLVLRRAAAALDARRPELVDLVITETGATRRKAAGGFGDSLEELHLAGAPHVRINLDRFRFAQICLAPDEPEPRIKTDGGFSEPVKTAPRRPERVEKIGRRLRFGPEFRFSIVY